MWRAGRSTCLPPPGLARAEVPRSHLEGWLELSDFLCETNQEVLSSKSWLMTTPLAQRGWLLSSVNKVSPTQTVVEIRSFVST